MRAFFQELMRVGIYKRNQGRITRQVTAAVMMIVMAIGLYQLSEAWKGWDPGLRSDVCAESAGVVELDPDGQIVIADSKGRPLEKHSIPESATKIVQQSQKVDAGSVLFEWTPPSNARLSAVVSYVLPFTLFLVGLWIVYRAVNVPGFADFLIAVEAEMNKVSWPTRSELTRASLVVLVTIFSLAAVLAVYDLFWNVLFTKVLKIY